MALRKMKVKDKIGHWEGRFPRYIPRSNGRTRAAGRANARCRTVERGWPDGRTHVAGRSNAKTASPFAAPVAQRGRGFANMPILLKAVFPGSRKISPGPLRVRDFRPRRRAKNLKAVREKACAFSFAVCRSPSIVCGLSFAACGSMSSLKPQVSNLKPQVSNLKSQTSNPKPQTFLHRSAFLSTLPMGVSGRLSTNSICLGIL